MRAAPSGKPIFHFAGHGRPAQDRQVYGSKGSLTCPGDRNGRPITLCFDGGTEVSGEEILGYAPKDYERKVQTSETLIELMAIRLLLRRSAGQSARRASGPP